MADTLTDLGEQVLSNVELQVEVAIDIQPLDAILREVKRGDIDAVVLATSGRSRVERAFMGSIADKVIRRASCPVVVLAANPDT